MNMSKLRFKYYSDTLSSKGLIVSGYADQYGRLMKVINKNNKWDYEPTGDSIIVKH